MTVETTARKQSFAGGQATLTFTFKALEDHPEDIKVVVVSSGTETLLTYTTHYTVSMGTSGVGGVVTVSPSYSTNYTYTVYRETTRKQESDYDDYNQFPADTLETDLDRRCLIEQELEETLDRAIRVPVSSSVTGSALQLPTPVAGLALVWNATATGIENSTYDPDAQVTNAANYATSASTSATEAANYVTSASTQAIAAATSSTLAGNYATSASTSATQAANYATSSSTSATAAANYATTASNVLIFTAAPSGDHEVSGFKIQLVAAAKVAFGDVCYINASGQAALIDADAIATASGLFMVCDSTIDAGSTGNLLIIGIARDDSWAWTVGGLVFASTTGVTGSTLTQIASTASSDVIQVIGVATHADRMYFNPSLLQVECA